MLIILLIKNKTLPLYRKDVYSTYSTESVVSVASPARAIVTIQNAAFVLVGSNEACRGQ